MPAKKPVGKTFEAVLEHGGGSLNWTIARVPFDVSKIWGKRGQLKVTGEINGFAFRTSLFPTREGVHFLIVNKKMQTGARVTRGAKARFRMQPDTTVRKIEPPSELTSVLRQSKDLRKYFESLSNSTRSYIAVWIAQGKHGETRKRRAEQMAERLMATMEAEIELPPVLKMAFARNPKAKVGWEKMPPSHRRFHLLGIFGTRNPESRDRRVEKALQAMIEYADKPAGRRTKTSATGDADWNA
ncbi:MAG TPA: YdeI/OmpD-associated family protein [Candidatus Angelobacter sp.]|jgi:uncharacterized protein YdeI (YjbR/CyaY-like superfamily)|nr:YdeI/OmpD-associated family protein [Candidatus Angelobacter sp.]